MRNSIPARTRLLAGQSLRLYADAGLIVIAASGTASIRPANGCVPVMQVLHDGDAHRIDDAGWITIAAHSEAEVVCAVDPPREDSLWQRVLAAFNLQLGRLAGKRA